MSDELECSAKVDPVVQPFVDFWSGYINQANDATRGLLEGINGNADAKTWQRRWFDTVAKSMDAYLRTPAFLEAMKHNTDLLVKAKRQADDVATEIARNANIPTASDISGLFERLHSVEEVILGRLEHIEDRLTTIEQQVGAGHAVGN
jgi:hypothetical protein